MTLPLIALGLASLLLILILVLNTGLGNLGRTQLQGVADNAARAALISIGQASRARPTTTIAQLQQIARSAAQEVAAGNTVIEGGIDAASSDLDIELGRFNLASGAFRRIGLMEVPTAVRVTARRSRESASGPFQSLIGSTRNSAFNEIQSDAVAISSLRCKNLVFVVDLSGSFLLSVGLVQGALQQALGVLESPDRVALVAFAGRVIEQSVRGEPVTSTMLVAPEDASIRDSIALLSESAGTVGTDIAAGIDRAEQLVREGAPNPNCENLAIVLSDGQPVGSTPGLTRAAAQRLARVSSIASVPIGAGPGGTALLRDLVSGFGQAFPANFNEESLASQTVRAIASVPPILVR